MEDLILEELSEDLEVNEELEDVIYSNEEYYTSVEVIDYSEDLLLINDSLITLNNTLHIFFIVFLLFALLSRFKIRGDD